MDSCEQGAGARRQPGEIWVWRPQQQSCSAMSDTSHQQYDISLDPRVSARTAQVQATCLQML